MSDAKSGHRIEYASSARAKCKGPKPCKGTTLVKGDLRFCAWRHWGCVTPKVIENVKKSFGSVEELGGFEELNEEDQQKLRTAWEAGHVAEEDIPATAKKDDDEEEKPKKHATKKEARDEGEEEEKPKKRPSVGTTIDLNENLVEMAESKRQEFPKTHRAVRWHPPSYDIRVEDVPFPKIEHPDDAIVKITLAGLCGSDLHIYRGHDVVTEVHTSGHEFVGEVVALGSNFLSVSGEQTTSTGRPVLYSTLKVGDRVVSPFTVSCGECRPCRQGFTSRCAHSLLFGSPALEGGQAQYVRVPYAGGTLFRLDDIELDPTTGSRLATLADSSLLLLADILPTGYFAALQLLQHPKLVPLLSGNPYPRPTLALSPAGESTAVPDVLNIALIGLGPVGICASVGLLDLLWKNGISYYRIIAIDPHEQRRELIKAIYTKLLGAKTLAIHPDSTFDAVDIKTANKVSFSADKVGFDGVIEAVGNTSAISLAFDLVRPFGVITSVGVHQDHPLPMSGRALRQDVFGEVGTETSLVDRIVGFDEAKASYELFNKGECGKVLFDPWK